MNVNDKNKFFYDEEENAKTIMQVRDAYRRGVAEQIDNDFSQLDQALSLNDEV